MLNNSKKTDMSAAIFKYGNLYFKNSTTKNNVVFLMLI